MEQLVSLDSLARPSAMDATMCVGLTGGKLDRVSLPFVRVLITPHDEFPSYDVRTWQTAHIFPFVGTTVLDLAQKYSRHVQDWLLGPDHATLYKSGIHHGTLFYDFVDKDELRVVSNVNELYNKLTR